MTDADVGRGASIASRRPREAVLLRALVLTTAVVLAAGLVTPLLTLRKFVVIESDFSVLSGIAAAWHDGRLLLVVLIGGFSVVLPALKLYLLYRALGQRGPRLDRLLQLIHRYGRWSMLDVFAVAVLVVAVKLGALASVELRYGFYLFAGAIVLIMVITARVVSLADLEAGPRHAR